MVFGYIKYKAVQNQAKPFKLNNSDFFQVIELNSLGRLLSYNPQSGSVTVLLDSLYMPNGIVLSPDEDFLLLAETSIGRILRFGLIRGYYTKLHSFSGG